MGNLLSYSGLSTKIRAMRSKLIRQEQFEAIAALQSVPQVVAYLKKMPEYQEILTPLDEENLHRGEVEKVLQKSIFRDFMKIYYFANQEQRTFLALYLKRYEIRAIKACLRSVFDRRDTKTDISQYREFFLRHSALDIDRLEGCTTLQEVIAALAGSDYYAPLSAIEGSGHDSLFDFGMALDLYYFQYIWKMKDKLFKGYDLVEITKAYGGKFDMLNMQWIYRSRLYYQMEPADIYALLIPVDYKLKKEEINAMVECSSREELQQIINRTYYGKKYQNISLLRLEEFYIFMMREILRQEAFRHPYSVAVIYSYLYQKEHEVNRLTIATECIRYGVSYEETMNYILKN